MSTEQARPVPQGISGLIISPDGHVVATHADFDRFTPGGFKLLASQKDRARIGLRRNFFRAHVSDRLTAKADSDVIYRFWENAAAHGYRMVLIPIGWEGEEIGS